MNGRGGRLERERRTIRAMVAIYCRAHHGVRGLCEGCAALQAYADARLDRCPYGSSKPTCFNCPVHCYKPAMREAVREVMRFAGPRMLRRHPVLAIRHMLDGSRRAESPPPSRVGGRTSERPRRQTLKRMCRMSPSATT
jgi:hypothetical protein